MTMGKSLTTVIGFKKYMRDVEVQSIYVRGKTTETSDGKTTVLVKTSKSAIEYLIRGGHGVDLEYFAPEDNHGHGFLVVEDIFRIQDDFVRSLDVIIV